jgi:hypothetical protein
MTNYTKPEVAVRGGAVRVIKPLQQRGVHVLFKAITRKPDLAPACDPDE